MKTKIDLINGNITKSLLMFAFPILISNIFQQFYSTVDIMIVGHYLGDNALAAVGAATSIFDLLVGFCVGIGTGCSMVIARSFGSGNGEDLKKNVASSLVIGFIISGVISFCASFLLMPLLKILNTPESIINQSYEYISVICAGIIVMFAYNLFSSFLKSIGDSFMSVVFLVIASIVNIVLDIVFITQFNMGIKGAALATVIAQGLSAFLCLIYILKFCKKLVPQKSHFKYNKEMYKELLQQGISMGLMSSIVSVGSIILQSAINSLGTLTIAGHTAARRGLYFCMMPIFTMAMALATFVSQNKGANLPKRIIKGVKVANTLTTVWAIIISVAMFFFAGDLVGFISGSSESVVLENGAKFLMINGPFLIALGFLMNLRFSLQGLGKKIVPIFSSVIECVGKILFVLFIIPKVGYIGVIFCEPIIWIIMTVQLVYVFYKDPYIANNK